MKLFKKYKATLIFSALILLSAIASSAQASVKIKPKMSISPKTP